MVMEELEFRSEDRALVLGATGFVGRRLVQELVRREVKLRLFVRNPSKVSGTIPEHADVEVAEGDLTDARGLASALEGIHSAFYLVHSLGGKTIYKNREFAVKDKQAARNFVEAAGTKGLKRVIYLGGLGEKGSGLSEHLMSRAEVADILRSGSAEATVLRAAVIIGAGGASFEMLRYLVERLPAMACPKWIDTKIQPIAVQDVIKYLAGCLADPRTAGKTFDIGGPEVLTYRKMMEQYADARGLFRRLIFTVPFMTPLLSSYWVDLVTPIPSGIAHPLIEGLKNEVVCRDDSINEFVPIKKTSFEKAVTMAIAEEERGPGVTGF